MNAIKKIIEKASTLNGTIVLPEGMDARVITAACSCVDRKICTPIVLGTPQEIADAEAKAGLSLAERGIRTIDYTQGDAELEAAYLEAWNAKESRKPAEKQKIIDENPEIMQIWDDETGDRMTSLCIIGRHMDKDALIAALDACLTDWHRA